MKNLSNETLKVTDGGRFDISLTALVEYFADEDLNDNGIVGFGCLIGC